MPRLRIASYQAISAEKKESRSHCSAFFQSSLENACCELVFCFQLCFLSSVERCAAPRRWLWHIATHNKLLSILSHSMPEFLFTHPPRPGEWLGIALPVIFLSLESNASLSHCILPSNLCGKKESRSHCSAFFQSSLENSYMRPCGPRAGRGRLHLRAWHNGIASEPTLADPLEKTRSPVQTGSAPAGLQSGDAMVLVCARAVLSLPSWFSFGKSLMKVKFLLAGLAYRPAREAEAEFETASPACASAFGSGEGISFPGFGNLS